MIVLCIVAFGLRSLGGPGNQRAVQADLRTLKALQLLAQNIGITANNAHGQLPADINALPSNLRHNPITGRSFTYHTKAGTAYELCAAFATATPASTPQEPSDIWNHPKGEYCFQLDASGPVPLAPFRY